MNTMNRAGLPLMVCASLVLAAGCNNQDFASVNQGLSGITQASNGVGKTDARIPTAAIATSLAALELLKAFAAGSGDKTALISAGGMNWRLLQLLPSPVGTTQTISQRGVEAKVTYRSTISPSSVKTTIEEFSGTSQGYKLTLAGEFEYLPKAGIPQVRCELAGSLSYRTLQVNVKEIKFDTTDPLPNDGDLGSFVLEVRGDAEKQTPTMEYTARIGVKKGKIEAEATVSQDGVAQQSTLTFSEDGGSSSL
ncbi:MAG: hypothetical protein VKN33_11050 [Candidatus Sericytochromatia bacterium]|nr:hypothetical protein [Candidatus Sericytochromatia bacterium]